MTLLTTIRTLSSNFKVDYQVLNKHTEVRPNTDVFIKETRNMYLSIHLIVLIIYHIYSSLIKCVVNLVGQQKTPDGLCGEFVSFNSIFFFFIPFQVQLGGSCYGYFTHFLAEWVPSFYSARRCFLSTLLSTSTASFGLCRYSCFLFFSFFTGSLYSWLLFNYFYI